MKVHLIGSIQMPLLQEGVPPRAQEGLLSNAQKWIVWGETYANSKRLYGKGSLGGEQRDKGAQESCSATWLTVTGFKLMGLVSRWSLGSHSDSRSFLVVRTFLSQDGFQQKGFWELGRTYGLEFLSPFDLSWILLNGGSLVVPCSLPGVSVVR